LKLDEVHYQSKWTIGLISQRTSLSVTLGFGHIRRTLHENWLLKRECTVIG